MAQRKTQWLKLGVYDVWHKEVKGVYEVTSHKNQDCKGWILSIVVLICMDFI